MINKKYFSIVIGIFLAAVIVGSFFDYQISTALFHRNNGFGIFLAAIGEFPGYAMLSFLGGYTAAASIKFYKKSWVSLLMLGGALVAFGCSAFFQGKAIFSVNAYNKPEYTLTFGLLIGVAMMAGPLILGYYFGHKINNKALIKVSFALLLSIAIAIGVITVVKLIPHRPRFRTVILDTNDVTYSPWWIINKDYKTFLSDTITKEEFKSFPSGHIGITTAMFFSVYFPLLVESNKSKLFKNIFFAISCVYIFLLAYTRILVGAHFLSDVGAGGVISLAIHLVTIFLIDMNLKKAQEKQGIEFTGIE